MIKMGLAYILLVSIPEETLLLIITLLVMGKKEYLNLKNKNHMIKMLSAVMITTLFSVLLYNYIEQNGFMMVVRVLFFVAAYWYVYKVDFYKVLISFLITITFYIMTEIIGIKITALITGIDYIILEQLYAINSIFVAFLIPRRILQIAAAVVLYKINFVILDFIFMRLQKIDFFKKEENM